MPVFAPVTPPVVTPTTFTGLASFWAAVTPRSCTVVLYWWQDVLGTVPSAIRASDTSPAITDSTTAWLSTGVSATAPSDAVAVSIGVNVAGCAASEVHYVDEVGVFPGVVTQWARGGLIGATAATILRSDGVYVRNATPANPLPIPWPVQQITIDDYEAVPDADYTYIATVGAIVNGAQLESAPSNPTAEVEIGTAGTWWGLDPTDPTTAFSFHRAGSQGTFTGGGSASLQVDSDERLGVFWALNADTYTIRHGDLMAEEFDLVMTFLDTAAWEKFDSLRKRKATVLLKSDMESTAYYVVFGASRPRVIMRSGDRTTTPASQVTVHCYPVARP